MSADDEQEASSDDTNRGSMTTPRAPKRGLNSTSRSVSPPPRRQKLHGSETSIDHVEAVEGIKKTPEVIKIVSWNVNGISKFFQKRLDPEPAGLRTHLKRHEWPQLLCLQEVKVNAKDNATQRRLQNCANESSTPEEPRYDVIFSLPRDPHNATGFGGKVHGVASLIRNDFVSSVTMTRRPDWDSEGRILIHEIGLHLVIFNGYWVNGTDLPWRNASGAVEGTRHDLKLRYHHHILTEALDYQRRGFHTLLVGDMNVAIDQRDGHPRLRTTPIQHVRNRIDFNAKFLKQPDGMRGIDVFRHFHGDLRKYTYYSTQKPWGQSCDRVDHIIASQSLLDSSSLVDSDICDNQNDAAHSDHVPLWVKVRLRPPIKPDIP
jgi:exonuclease III